VEKPPSQLGWLNLPHLDYETVAKDFEMVDVQIKWFCHSWLSEFTDSFSAL